MVSLRCVQKTLRSRGIAIKLLAVKEIFVFIGMLMLLLMRHSYKKIEWKGYFHQRTHCLSTTQIQMSGSKAIHFSITVFEALSHNVENWRPLICLKSELWTIDQNLNAKKPKINDRPKIILCDFELFAQENDNFPKSFTTQNLQKKAQNRQILFFVNYLLKGYWVGLLGEVVLIKYRLKYRTITKS